MDKKQHRERELGLYVAEKERDAEIKVMIGTIKNVMQNLKVGAKEAMNVMGIAPNDQKIYLPNDQKIYLPMLKKQ